MTEAAIVPEGAEAATTRSAGEGYLASVDGLRAIAVAAVIAFHFQPIHLAVFQTGWVGVWLFFCISGFVITRSLLADTERGGGWTSILTGFYRSRAVRIWPLYLLIILVGALVLVATGTTRFLGQLPYLLTFTFNFFRMGGHYENTEIFGHLWSLSVEQQFYLVYPLLVLALRRRLDRLALALTVALVVCPLIRLGVASWAASTSHDPEAIGNAVYQFSVGHFDSFAAGGLLAIAERRGRLASLATPLAYAALAAALLLLAALALTGPNLAADLLQTFHVNTWGSWRPVVVYSLLALWSSAAIAAAAGAAGPVRRVLEWRPLVYIGQISYGLYIYHYPLIYAREHLIKPHWPKLNTTLSFAVYAVILVAICHLSHVAFEKPLVRRLKRRPRPGPAASAVTEDGSDRLHSPQSA